MNRLSWFIEDHFGLILFVGFIVFLALAVVGTLWAYDGDVKCLIAECRKLK